MVITILVNKIIEEISIEKRCQLCENEFISEHMQSLILNYKVANSSPSTRKMTSKDYISIIQKK